MRLQKVPPFGLAALPLLAMLQACGHAPPPLPPPPPPPPPCPTCPGTANAALAPGAQPETAAPAEKPTAEVPAGAPEAKAMEPVAKAAAAPAEATTTATTLSTTCYEANVLLKTCTGITACSTPWCGEVTNCVAGAFSGPPSSTRFCTYEAVGGSCPCYKGQVEFCYVNVAGLWVAGRRTCNATSNTSSSWNACTAL